MRTDQIRSSAEKVFGELEKRFIHHDTGLLLNYADQNGEVSLPTADEIQNGKPSHMSWNTPIEDGAYYSGLYFSALCDNKLRRLIPQTAQAAERIADGLISLSESDDGVPGFVARNYAGFPKAHYACGSEDQTFPWFYGLYRFWKSGASSDKQRLRCASALVHVAEALHKSDYRIPCSTVSFGYKGNFSAGEINNVAKLVFVQRAMYEITGDRIWHDRYASSLSECPDGKTETRLAILRHGVGYPVYDGESVFYCLENGEYSRDVFNKDVRVITFPFFTMTMASIAINAVCEMEDVPDITCPLAEALARDANAAATHICRYKGFDVENAPKYSDNWRIMNTLWCRQQNAEQAAALAWREMPLWFCECPRFPYENAYVREPLFAAYATLLSPVPPEQQVSDEICRMLAHYRWDRLNTSTFYSALLVIARLLHFQEIK